MKNEQKKKKYNLLTITTDSDTTDLNKNSGLMSTKKVIIGKKINIVVK